MRKKICLLADSLSSGGAEKMVSNLSISLSRKGYELVIVSMNDEITYPYLGELYNFGEIKKSKNQLNSFLNFKSFFKKQNFDVIIDHRVRNKFVKEFLFSRYVFKNFNVIYCIHHYKLSYYFSKFTKSSLLKFQHVKKRKFVAVSLEIQKQLKKQLKIESNLIYNYTLLSQSQKQELHEDSIKEDYIIGVGRLEKIKQFDVLISSYKDSLLPQNNIKLLIFGNGEEKENLKQLINDLKLEKQVVMMGFSKDVLSYVEKAKALVLSSKSEGFPMVLIEALALKTPIISFDCKSGPNEIIKNEINGLLVEDQNQKELSNSLNKLLDNKLYSNLKEELISGVNQFSEESIFKQWIQVLETFK